MLSHSIQHFEIFNDFLHILYFGTKQLEYLNREDWTNIKCLCTFPISPPLSFDNSLYFEEDYSCQTFESWPIQVWYIILLMNKLNEQEEPADKLSLLKSPQMKKAQSLRTTNSSRGVLLQFFSSLPYFTFLFTFIT
jgi:hypothetical protein